MRYFAVIGFASVAILASVIATTYATNSTWGARGYYDSLLHREYVIESSKWLREVSRDVTYPPRGYYGQRVITAVRAIDQNRNRTGGYPLLYRGGPGFRNVTVHFQSQRGKGLNYILEIYGR